MHPVLNSCLCALSLSECPIKLCLILSHQHDKPVIDVYGWSQGTFKFEVDWEKDKPHLSVPAKWTYHSQWEFDKGHSQSIVPPLSHYTCEGQLDDPFSVFSVSWAWSMNFLFCFLLSIYNKWAMARDDLSCSIGFGYSKNSIVTINTLLHQQDTVSVSSLTREHNHSSVCQIWL